MLKMYEQASYIQTHLRHSGHSVRTINTLNLNVRFLHKNELANKQRRNNVNGDTEAKSIKTIWDTLTISYQFKKEVTRAHAIICMF